MRIKPETTRKPLVFVSHIHEESSVALVLQEHLSRMFLQGIEIFVSSDRETIRAGDDWLLRIREGLSQACKVFVLLSPRSLGRNWINFEAGAAWLSETRKVIPLCHSGLLPCQLPPPLHALLGLDLHDQRDVEDMCRLVADAADLSLPTGATEFLFKSIHLAVSQLDPAPLHPLGATAAWVFPKSEDPATHERLDHSLKTAKDVRLFAIGLNFFWNAGYLSEFEARISANSLRARVCMANFNSTEIRRRLDEEPAHPIGIPGSEHLLKRLVRLENDVGNAERFSLRVFDHYPTYATLQFDDEVYIYPYGFKALGNFSPTFYWRGGHPATRFFADQFESMWSHCKPARLAYPI